MPSRNPTTRFFAVLMLFTGQAATAFAANSTGAAVVGSVAPMLAVSAPTSSVLPAKPTSLSSAKTVRELIEIDDRIALKKEKANLAQEEAKEKTAELGSKKASDDAGAKPATRTPSSSQKGAAASASMIRIDAIMGLDGSRVVTGMIGDKAVSFLENSRIATNGWKLVSLFGQCGVFEKESRNDGSDSRPNRLRVHTGGTPEKAHLNAPLATSQTACFVPPAVTPGYPTSGGAMASSGNSRPGAVPVPLPFYAPSQAPLPVTR